jgi:hypothetical protein
MILEEQNRNKEWNEAEGRKEIEKRKQENEKRKLK